MYMAPTVKATPPSATLRLAVRVPMLALAGLVALLWIAAQALVAGLVLGTRAGGRR